MLNPAARTILPPAPRNDNKHVAWTRQFTGDGRDFSACSEAEELARRCGFAVGRTQAGAPRGLMHGYAYVAKWRNLTLQDRAQLHGVMFGDMRRGPVMIVVYVTAPFEIRVALSGQPKGRER
ncbi:MAG TPA: hypothetical protein VNZ94_01890 [Xanthobacteraceae bacterium]|nr:hypothetical protein [Xanthobacteraceae bacterium]